MINGRAAMIGFAVLCGLEITAGVPFFLGWKQWISFRGPSWVPIMLPIVEPGVVIPVDRMSRKLNSILPTTSVLDWLSELWIIVAIEATHVMACHGYYEPMAINEIEWSQDYRRVKLLVLEIKSV